MWSRSNYCAQLNLCPLVTQNGITLFSWHFSFAYILRSIQTLIALHFFLLLIHSAVFIFQRNKKEVKRNQGPFFSSSVLLAFCLFLMKLSIISVCTYRSNIAFSTNFWKFLWWKLPNCTWLLKHNFLNNKPLKQIMIKHWLRSLNNYWSDLERTIL